MENQHEKSLYSNNSRNALKDNSQQENDGPIKGLSNNNWSARDTLKVIAEETLSRLPLGGRYYLIEGKGGWEIRDDANRLIESITGIYNYQDQQLGRIVIIIMRGKGRDYSGATLPGTKALILGEKYYKALKDPQEETEIGYTTGESLKMIVGHELTHILFHNLPTKKREEIISFFAKNWGTVYNFASNLLVRQDYRDHILKHSQLLLAKKPNAKTRQVALPNGQRIDIPVELIIDELLAYYSGIQLIGEQRMRELAKINPTRQVNCREYMSVLAAETFNNLGRNPQNSFLEKIQHLVPNEERVKAIIDQSRRLM